MRTALHVDRFGDVVTKHIDSLAPVRRTAGLVVRVQDDETLILDTATDAVHCLPAEVARVWHACTAGRTVADVADVAQVSPDVADSALAQLLELELVEAPAGLDRRRFLKRTGIVGAGLVAIPAIQSVVAPSAFAALSIYIHIDTISCNTTTHKASFTYSFGDTGNNGNVYTATLAYANGSTSVIDNLNGGNSQKPGGGYTGTTSQPLTGAQTITITLYKGGQLLTSSTLSVPGC